ncbi:UvrD-helicase domain-containing protein [Thiomicrorhabdus aquaedulcis]|uniref:UvrD-helicase domain-containing protein n=1 Tax=Thiomicrorhabdus aquaedulcis TaxID=2211106 RepID=UPI000FD8A6B7|nr:ATP-dependent helicase [Thiomicrorhabdus aquaedulcis]
MAALNSFQKHSVETEGHLLITACPGSGKTTVLSFRAEHLLAKYPTGNLLAVTFTKDAAEELKSRILTKVPFATNRIGTGTFHGLAMEQISRSGMKIDLLAPYESKAIISNALDGLSDPPEFEVVENMFNALQSSLNPLDHPYAVSDPVIRYVWSEYQKVKDSTGKMDFSDLILLAIKGMRDGSVKPFNARWVLGDESQDMDEVQYAWIMAHATNGSEITLVGDDDQSVYSWRGAQGYEGMKGFQLALDASSNVLPVNYRCGKIILAAAIRLIEQNNPNRIEKPIQAGVSFDGLIHAPIAFQPCKEKGAHKSLNEFEGVVNEIILQTFKTSKSSEHYTDWAILARGNMALSELERILLDNNIAYSRKSGSFWDIPVIRSYLAVLNYLTENKWFGFAIFINNFLATDMVFDKRVKNLASLYKIVDCPDIKAKVRTLLYYEHTWRELLKRVMWRARMLCWMMWPTLLNTIFQEATQRRLKRTLRGFVTQIEFLPIQTLKI